MTNRAILRDPLGWLFLALGIVSLIAAFAGHLTLWAVGFALQAGTFAVAYFTSRNEEDDQ